MKLLIVFISLSALAQNYDGSNFAAVPQHGMFYGSSKLVLYCDFETSTNGTDITVPILNSSCHSDPAISGVWSIVGTIATGGIVISTSAQAGPTTPQFVVGTPYLEATGTRGLAYKITDIGSATHAPLHWNWTSTATIATAFAWVKFPYKSGSGSHETSMLGYIANGGSDFTTAQSSFGKAYLETQGNPNGASDWCTGSCDASGFFDYAIDTWYGLELEFHTYPDPYHFYRVYSCTLVGNKCTVGALLHASAKATRSVSPHYPTLFSISLDDETDTGGPVVGLTAYIDSLRISLSGSPIYP